MTTITLTAREARVAADVLVTVSAYTYAEAREQFGWTRTDLDAWSSAHAKIDAAATR